MKHLFLVVWGLLPLQWVHSRSDDRTNCKPVTASFCQGVGYTTTLHPTGVLGYTLTINRFNPLVTSGCSPHLKPFLCSVYVPECVSGKPRPPCRTLCEHARSSCGAQMRSLSLEWPEALNCETFTTEPWTGCRRASTKRQTSSHSHTDTFGQHSEVTLPACSLVSQVLAKGNFGCSQTLRPDRIRQTSITGQKNRLDILSLAIRVKMSMQICS
uniref:FZ domain-containing protein n=1 Tax=Oreochromis niloticus TaxID=8128 RepID=A0A669BWT1_ORENI